MCTNTISNHKTELAVYCFLPTIQVINPDGIRTGLINVLFQSEDKQRTTWNRSTVHYTNSRRLSHYLKPTVHIHNPSYGNNGNV